MKILHIIYSMNIGGAETMLVDIANEQARRGHEVGVLVINNFNNEELISHLDPAVAVHRFNRREGSMPLLLMARLNIFVASHRPDIIHLHNHKLNGLLLVGRSHTLYTVHDLKMPMTYAARSNMAAISDAVREDVLRRVPDARIRTVNNAINISNITPRDGRIPRSGEEFRLVQVARLDSAKKGQDILIGAVAELRRRGRNVSVTFIGDGADRDALASMAADSDAALAVRFTGSKTRKQVYRTLHEYDAMCHPARYEGFGLTIAEAMAAQLPLILPEGGGPWEVADHGRLCTCFAGGDITACADAIESVMDNYAQSLALARESAAYAADNYSVQRMVDRYIDYYNDLLG